MRDLHHELISHGFIETVDPKLCKLDSDKFFAKMKLNKLLRTWTENVLFDYWVRDRWTISAKGKDQIKNHKK